jgi:hypothetical protein
MGSDQSPGQNKLALVRNRAIRQLILRQAQIISAAACLSFLVTTGTSEKTIISSVIAALFMMLRLTFKLKPRQKH